VPPSARYGAHFLVVEDNLVNQKVATAMLVNQGHRVDVASSGHDAVRAMSESFYDMVFMDCQMPGMDGFEATRSIRITEGSDRHTPIIAMTAGAMVGDRETCLAAGMDDYLTKPVRRDEFARAVDRWLPEGRFAPPVATASPKS
jgi:CheY-like chemotaxis protein